MSASDPATDPGAIARAYFEAVGARDVEAMMGFWEPGGTGSLPEKAMLAALNLKTRLARRLGRG